jgi:hypothetical protein
MKIILINLNDVALLVTDSFSYLAAFFNLAAVYLQVFFRGLFTDDEETILVIVFMALMVLLVVLHSDPRCSHCGEKLPHVQKTTVWCKD